MRTSLVHTIVDDAFDLASRRSEHAAIQIRADINSKLWSKSVELVVSRMGQIRQHRFPPGYVAMQLADELAKVFDAGLTPVGWSSWVDRIRRDMPVVWYVAWEGWRATKMGVDPDPRWVRGFFPICGPRAPAAWWPHRHTEDPHGQKIETNTKTDAAHLTRVFAELEAVGLMVREMTPARRNESPSWQWLPCEGPMPDIRAHGGPFYDEG